METTLEQLYEIRESRCLSLCHDPGPSAPALYVSVAGLIAELEQRDDLLAASQKLVVELSGWPVDKLHEIGGHTNAQVLFMRLNEAKAVIAKATPDPAATP